MKSAITSLLLSINLDIRNFMITQEVFEAYDINYDANSVAESHIDLSIEIAKAFLTNEIIIAFILKVLHN